MAYLANEYVGASDNESGAEDSESELSKERRQKRKISDVGAGPSHLGDSSLGSTQWSSQCARNSLSSK